MSNINSRAVDLVVQDMVRKSRDKKYLDDPVLWVRDILGRPLWSKQREIAYSVRDNVRTAVRSSNGTGKQLTLDTPLPTPTGWTTMGDVKVGDYVLDEMGKPTKVTYISPVRTLDTFAVTFSDGAVLHASGDHLWNTIDFKTISRYRNHHKITDYRELWDLSETRDTYTLRDTVEHNGYRNHYIPINATLDLPEADLLIDPYVLGVWLGDGTSRAAALTLGESKRHIVDEFERRGVSMTETPHEDRATTWTFAHQGFLQAFRQLGVYQNKHIPDIYLRASKAQRLDLLRGLMDTDGFLVTSSRGKSVTGVGIDLMNEQLARGVVELVRSLGTRCSIREGRTYLNGRDVGTRYRMNFNPAFDPFSSESPKSQGRHAFGAQQSRKTVRTIVSIEEVEAQPSRCIAVDNPRHLYLAGREMIPTHNTFLSSALAAWWIAMHDVHDTIVITTAPSFPQIKTNLFSELQARKRDVDRRVQAKELAAAYKLPGKINTSGNVAEWKLPDGTQLALGRKPAENDIITTFQGIHRRYVLFIIDEAGGLDPDMFVAAERMTTGADARILAVGNPDRRGSEFFRMFQPDSDWNQIHISAYDTPAFTGEECPEELLRYMPQPDWVERNIRAWGGVDDPRVKISILGEFPDDDASVFFSETAMRNAKSTEITPDGEKPTILGVDLSGSGMDESKIYVNRDGRIRKVKSWSQTHALESARIIDKVAREEGATYVNIDNGGLGKPIIENMYDLFPVSERPYKIVEMNGAGDVPDRRRWYNARAWWYDMLREGMLLGEIDLDPDDAPLFEQMGDIGYDFAETGARAGSIIMEKKKDIRSRSGRSPDDLDACVYASFNPETEQETQKPDTMYTDPEEILGDLMPDYMRAIGGFWL